MEIRNQLTMTSLPIHSHSVGNCIKQPQKHANSTAGSATVGSTMLFAGGGHGNNGLTAGALTIGTTASDPAITHDHHGLRPVKTSATAGGAGFDGNHIDPASAGPGSYGRNGLTLSAGSPGPETGIVSTDGNGVNTNILRSSNVVNATTVAIHAENLQVSSSLDLKASMKTVRYRECLKNHAANLGGHANDGCGEFMPSGVEGTIEALKCAACSCHRNFHRREVEEGEGGYAANLNCRYGSRDRKRMMEPFFPSPLPFPSPAGLRIHPRSAQMIMALNAHDSDDYEGGLLCPQSPLKKRFRTKFTAEQKEQMGIFAEKLGWRMQKHDDAAVQQFCAEIGVKRHVLKVWMHNNKHALGKKQLAEEIADPSTHEEEMRA